MSTRYGRKVAGRLLTRPNRVRAGEEVSVEEFAEFPTTDTSGEGAERAAFLFKQENWPLRPIKEANKV